MGGVAVECEHRACKSGCNGFVWSSTKMPQRRRCYCWFARSRLKPPFRFMYCLQHARHVNHQIGQNVKCVGKGSRYLYCRFFLFTLSTGSRFPATWPPVCERGMTKAPQYQQWLKKGGQTHLLPLGSGKGAKSHQLHHRHLFVLLQRSGAAGQR